MVLAKPLGPKGLQVGKSRAQSGPQGQLDGMALAIIKPNGFNAFEPLKRPSETGGGILSSRKQHQGRLMI